MALEARHRLTDERTELAEIGAILGADDEPEVTFVCVPALRCFSRIERIAGLVVEGLIAALSLARQISDRCVNVLLGRPLLATSRLSLITDLGLVLPSGPFPAKVGDMGPERRCPPRNMVHEPGLHHDTTLGHANRSRA
jgi:hypothetical protein